MYVPEKLNGLVVNVVGEAEEREMVKNDCPTLYDEDFLEVNTVKPPVHRSLPEYPIRVMVSEDEVDMTVQPVRVRITLQAPVPFLNIAEAEISKMIHMVVRPHNGIPVSHDSLIHCFNGLKRPIAILEDVVVKEMS